MFLFNFATVELDPTQFNMYFTQMKISTCSTQVKLS